MSCNNHCQADQGTAARSVHPVPRRLDAILLAGLLFIHAGLLAWGGWRSSPTVDEPAYLSAGVSHWTFGRFDLAKVSPPLVRLVAAIPVCLTSHVGNWDNYRIGPGIRSEHSVGHDFLVANGRRSFWLMTIGRWACIPFSLIGAWVCYRWSLQLWGRRAACAAAVLWCCDPNILAHGQMLTPDTGVAALSLAAAYAYWKWSTTRGWRQAILAGAVLGLAVLAKTNAVVLLVVLPLLSLPAVLAAADGVWNRLAQVTLSLVVAVYVINLGYGFDGSLNRLDSYDFASRTFRGDTEEEIGNRFRNSAIGWIPVPFPRPFLEGIDLQRRDFENPSGRSRTYWRGRWYQQSWWWYYLYGSAVKVPIGAWALLLVACGVQCRLGGLRSWLQPDLLFVVVPGMALFAIASSQTGFGHGLRYVLPAFPFVLVLASSAFRQQVRALPIRLVAAVALVGHAASSLAVYPHSLSYFNEVAGGPRNGHAHLLDGNLDWGQDLLFLERWLSAHPQAHPIHVGYWGFLPLDQMQVNHSDFDFQAEPGDPSRLPAGWYAVSVNHLRQDFRMGNPKYASFLDRPPVAMAGYSIYIYKVQ